MLRLMPKFACNQTKTGSITDPAERNASGTAETFPVRPKGMFLSRTKNFSEVSTNQHDIKNSKFLSLYWTEWTALRKKPHLLEVSTFGSKHPVILDAQHPLLRLFL